jgi:hypothetical protein
MDCTAVPPGWYCGGEAGHEGPCAAWPPCWFCGYLGPGLEPLAGTSAICSACARSVIPIQLDTHDTLWEKIKAWLKKF